MALQIALELVRVEEAQRRRARPEVAARRARTARRRRQVVHPHRKLFQLSVRNKNTKHTTGINRLVFGGSTTMMLPG